MSCVDHCLSIVPQREMVVADGIVSFVNLEPLNRHICNLNS